MFRRERKKDVENKISIFKATKLPKSLFVVSLSRIIRLSTSRFLKNSNGTHKTVSIPYVDYKTVRLIALLILVLASIYVIATQADETTVEFQTLNIFPDSIESSGWDNVDSLYSQDLTKDAILQEFSMQNSAYLSEKEVLPTSAGSGEVDGVNESINVESGVGDSDSTSSDTPAEVSSDTESGALETEPVFEDTEPVSVPDLQSEEEPDEEEPANDATEESVSGSEPVSQRNPVDLYVYPKPNPQSLTFSFQTTERLAQVETTDGVVPEVSNAPTDEDASPTETEASDAEVEEVSVDEAISDFTVDMDGDEFSNEVSDEMLSEVADTIIQSENESTGEGSETDTETITAVPEPIIQQIDERFNCIILTDCDVPMLEFSGFDVPSFDGVTSIESTQIRLSFGGTPSSRDVYDSLRLFYSFDGATWSDAGSLILDDEVTNAVNGGYFLFALPSSIDRDAFANLRVRVAYDGSIESAGTLYVDSLWVEVNAVSFYEPEGELYTDEITYSRNLALPFYNELLVPTTDFLGGDLPNFYFEYKSQENIIERFFEFFSSRRQYEVVETKLMHSRFGEMDVESRIEYAEDGTWRYRLLDRPQRMRSGKYVMSITVEEDGKRYTDTFEFYWGVLAINTKKSMYNPNEAVELHMAALTETGDTICDANLKLTIIDPSQTVHELDVNQGGDCGPNNVTDVPDYISEFTNTSEVGVYQISLTHYNKNGDEVHRTHDTFEVREYIPYDIERTAPTRIYPPAPYTVTLTIDANQSFVGQVKEPLPRGFVVLDAGGGSVTTLGDLNYISWNLELKEGETRTLSYMFDAPDVSPYLYLLGPLDMDGFKEIRSWQIASDALGGVAWLTSTGTDNGTDLNTTSSRLLWGTSTVDTFYFTHSTSTDSNKLTINQDGDYMVALTLPVERTDANGSRTRIGAEVRVNGVAVPEGLARSSYIRNANAHSESSSHVSFLLSGLEDGDYVEVFTEGLATIDSGDDVIISGEASLYVEYIAPSENVFSATTTRTVASTNLNGVTASELQWAEVRQDSGYAHSDTINPENITLSASGTYMVFVNIPLEGDTTQQNIQGRVLLHGVEVPGGRFAQGYLRGSTDSDPESSIHWSGIVVATTTGRVLSVSVEQEAAAGTTTVPTGFAGSIFIQKLPTEDVIVLRGNDLSGGTDWSDTPAESILWQNRDVIDSVVFTHSTSSNSDDITVNENGDYLLAFNDSLTSATGRANVNVTVQVDGNQVVGAETKSNYIRNQSNHTDSSGSLVYLLEGLTAGQVINVMVEQEANAATVNDSTAAIMMLWKKAELNLRPQSVTFYNEPFDSIRFSSTTPKFEFSALDPDGSSGIVYQISWSTSTDFTASTTKTSGIDSGFSNISSSTNMSPFTEGDRIRYQIQTGDGLQYNTTYYWRVRAQDIAGSSFFGDWSSAQSMVIEEGVDTPQWLQTTDGQFETNSLTLTRPTGNGSVEVAVADNTEVLFAYAESTNTTLQYKMWDGEFWGAETPALDVGGVINWVVVDSGNKRDEYVVGTLDANNDANFMVYTASTTSWGNLTELATTTSNVSRRGIAVAYESDSGDALAVACDGDADPRFSIWNGSTWSSFNDINLNSGNNCEVLYMASDPTSDEIILVARDTGAQYEAQVWNGNTWTESHILGSMQAGDEVKEGLSVVYEESGNQAIVVTTNGTGNSFRWNSWNGTEWGISGATVALGNDFENGRLVADEGTDRIALCYIDDDSDVGAIIWDGDGWGSFTELTTTGNDDRGRAVDCEFETTAGRDGYLLAPYSDTGTDGDYHAINNSSWTSNLSGSDINDAFWVQTVRAGDGTILAMHYDDENDDIDFTYWNGSVWSGHDTIEDTPSSVATPNFETGMMAAKRFISEVGTVFSNPIAHASVPNQATWGDIYFNTTETLGADVKLQVYYSDVASCDALVPDGALPGNSSGFDVSQSPLNISGLATTTYGELCLSATLTQVGGTSPTLDSWRVTWERSPYVVQNYFQWYVNGSFFTPTDAWPTGIIDVAENTPIPESAPIDLGEQIRLRMSLLVENVPLATSTESFKIQYGAGDQCSLVTEWADLGEVGSTTALWRGYTNAIVGDDWYDEDWGRRIEVTIDSGLVDDDLSDFPVYLNLGDLPAEFFLNVQADGDDIRITESDGITELPFELVSINTGTEAGELHFKADLSSTTDSQFFVYYGNASASGYAASATYGSRNVWTSSYNLRYAMDDDPTYQVSAVEIFDSTSNSNDANTRNTSGMTSGDVVSGHIGNALNFDGNDGAFFENIVTFSGEFTISMWWRTQNIVNADGFAIASADGGSNEKIGPWNTPAGNAFVRTTPGTVADTGVTHPADGTWTHVVITRDSSNKIDLHFNGATTRLHSDATRSGNSNWHNFGGDPAQGFEGDLDEIRFASVRRTNGWIDTEYNNQSNPTGFYAVSGEQLIGDGGEIPSTLLSVSDVTQTYQEENPTVNNINGISVNDDGEWDFVIENHNASSSTEYCFRMVYSDGGQLDSYAFYPQLVTNAPPPPPTLSKPFDNEKVVTTGPVFEFSADDEAGDDVSYQIQVDTDYAFGSPDIDNDSETHGVRFENILVPADKDPFTSGQTMRYTPNITFTNGNTYWWRVRAKDPNGSNTYGEWSTPESFTVDTTITATTWFQTTDEQFNTNTLEDASSNSGGEDVRITTSFTTATVTTNSIDFDDGDSEFGNAWGNLDFSDVETGGDIKYAIEYLSEDSTWSLVPDSDLAGNSAGFDSGPVSLISLSTETYNVIRLRAVLTDSGSTPQLQDWTLSWGYRVETPTLLTPFDNAKVATRTPSFTFTATDPEGDLLIYEFSLSTTSTFVSSTTYLSNTSGFENLDQVGSTSPYTSDDTIRYTIQVGDILTSSSTYWWRVRARDPGGSDVFSFWSDPRSITVDESIVVSTWFQTVGEQFETNVISDIDGNTASQQAEIDTTLREAMVAYGEGAVQSPRYRLWDGSNWSEEDYAESVGAQIEYTVLKPAPTRNEYALATLGTDGDANVQIYNGDGLSWGSVKELAISNANTGMRGVDLAYESNSGDLIAVACDGTEAVFSTWNGSSWTATSSLPLANPDTCLWIRLASNPTSDEIVMVVRSNNTGGTDYEAQVWNGSAWDDSLQLGKMAENAHEGMAGGYEESGDQAVVVVSSNASPQFVYSAWDGSVWSSSTVHTIGNDFEWGELTSDVGTDVMTLCYIDENADLGIVRWNGGSWLPFEEFEVLGQAKQGRPVSCQYETQGSRDGYLMVPYSDDGAGGVGDGGKYQFYATSSFSGEIDLDTIEDSYNVISSRTGDGIILSVFLDDVNDDYVFTSWDGVTWSTPEVLDTNPSVTGTPFHESVALASRVYPAFTSGSMRSTPINYSDGTGPRWEQAFFTDTTPGASTITYQIYYGVGTSTALVPEEYLPGNAAGFTTSPIDLTLLDKNIHDVLYYDATFECSSGDCPTLQDWTVEWAEGIEISGTAYEYDGTTTVTSGSVAVAVNGVLQAGKTGTIQGDGTWSIENVTIFEGETAVVFISGADDSGESVAVATYDGLGDMDGLRLSKRTLSIGSNDSATTTHESFVGYDSSDTEDIFFSIVNDDLTLCAVGACHDAKLTVLQNTKYQPGSSADSSVHDFINYGRFIPNGNTLRVSGSWYDYGTTSIATSSVIFTATSSIETLFTASSTYAFNNLTFGETSGNATWTLSKAMDVDSTFAIDYGTLVRGTSTLTIGGNFRIGAGGSLSGISTTTFDGTGSNTWTDSTASSTDVGFVVVNGTSKTITQGSNVRAQSITIGSDDTLNASAGSYTLFVANGWTNNNSFVPQNGTVTFTGTTTNTLTIGNSTFNNLSFTGANGVWYFSTSSLTLSGTLTIATGTVTLPSGTTTISGSFLNTGGVFAHNNGTVNLNSSVAGRSITLGGTPFLNAFYNLRFSGSGSWSFTEANATTSHNFSITSGAVTFPSSTLTVRGSFTTSGSGSFAHNNGEVVFVVDEADSATTNGSSFNNVRVRGGASTSWYDEDWQYRVPITINNTNIDDDLSNFPVYVNLDDLPAAFFSNVASDGRDVRVTASDGITELPRELVSIDTSGTAGELYFRANAVSSTTDTTFYLYYGNSGATDYASTSTYGARAVWSNGYVVVNHMSDLTTASTLNSTGTVNGTKTSANNPLESTSGKIYDAQDFSGDSVQHAGTVLTNQSQYSVSLWLNPDALTGGNADQQSFGYSVYGISAAGAPYQWLRAGGTANPTNLTLCAYDAGTTCNVSTGAGLTTGSWYHVSINAIDGGATTLRVNGTQRLSFTNTGNGTVSANFTIADLRPARNINFDGRIDEVRVANVTRSTAWHDAEYRNTATTTSFYTTGAQQSGFSRTFSTTNTTVLGNLTLELGGDSIFPSGTLSVGGSFDNNAVFDANGGTVLFNSTSGSETIAAGSSTFATLTINSGSGDFTITEHATATTAINLTSASAFTVASGVILESRGTFTNQAVAASTTWTGSTLKLSSGNDFALNTKVHAGDTYGTIHTTGDTDISLWNSSAVTYTTEGVSSIYSQDHSGIDGELYIFGNYERTSGTEYWHHAFDFDGTALSSTTRQVDVRIASSTLVNISGTLFVLGTSTATTTIANQGSGSYALSVTNGSTTASYYEFTGMASSGVSLLGSTTVSTLSYGRFVPAVPSGTGLTVSSTTINRNPALQIYGVDFSTTTAISATNVTQIGSVPTSFWWFRDSVGNIDGEAFDSDTGNPGSIRWDDSSLTITISGVVYSDAGVTPMSSSTCNGSTQVVRVVVNGGTSYTGSCAVGTGAFSIGGVAIVGDPVVTVYLDTNGGAKGTVVTRTPTGDITNFNIYANRVITRHQNTAPLTILNMARFDNDNDTDISYTAATGTLTLFKDTELRIGSSTTFVPDGSITIQANASNTSFDGSLVIDNGATFTGSGTSTYTIGGSFTMNQGGTFTPALTSVVMNATTSGKTITTTANQTIPFNTISFNGVGGGWNVNGDIQSSSTITASTGTISGTGDITILNGSFIGDGTVSMGQGTTTMERTNVLGGATSWTFANLVLGNGSVVGTTTSASIATTTILGKLTISNAHFFNAGGLNLNFTGTGNVFTETGTFLEGTSTVRYSGASGSNVISTNYYNLDIKAVGGAPTYTATGLGIVVGNDLRIGGPSAGTFTLNTNDPALDVNGSLTIESTGTLVGSNSGSLTVAQNWENDGVFTASGGTVTFDGSAATLISAGSSPFATANITGTGSFTVNEHATATVAFSIGSSSTFSLSSGQALAVGGTFSNQLGGAGTTWTDSTLHLYGGGNYTINASTTQDTFGRLVVGGTTQIRMWNSEASAYDISPVGSLYSQDHENNNGELSIYGAYTKTSGNDYWSYTTDFDGTNISGTPRSATIRIASGSSILYTGGGLGVIGADGASTTIQNQGSGTFSLRIGGVASTTWSHYDIEDLDSNGLTFSGTPNVVTLSNGDIEVSQAGGSGISVGGTVINANPAKNFVNNVFATTTGVSGFNVTATGTSLSSWRFTLHSGDIDGEDYDVDPDGDPGYVVWDNSTSSVSIQGRVYSDEGATVSDACAGFVQNITLYVAGVLEGSTDCDETTGAYAFTEVNFSPNDPIIVYIEGEPEVAATVSADLVSSISNFDLYENRVIVRHENTDPLSIADMAPWDSSDDASIPFTAVDSAPDTLTLPANQKLIVWSGKEFEPNGNVTLSGGGGGGAQDGTLELFANAIFTAGSGESHTIGGSLISGSNATFESDTSTVTFTTSGASRTINTNENPFYNVTFNGSGSWTVNDSVLTAENDFTISQGALTLPTGTTTIGGSFVNSGGSFSQNGGSMYFVAAGSETVRQNGSVFGTTTFAGTGSYSYVDTHATSTGDYRILSGTVTAPSGSLGVGGSFIATGTFAHNNGSINLTASGVTGITTGTSDLSTVNVVGAGSFTFTNTNVALLGSLRIAGGSVNLASGTMSIGGSFINTGGSFYHASGTILFNSTDTGEVINPGSSLFHGVSLASASGGWTINANATATANFSLVSASNFTQSSSTRLTVKGIFTNLVGGGATTWTGSTLEILSGSSYTINTKTAGGDVYNNIIIGSSTALRVWDSAGTVTMLDSASSLYSQDHAGVSGNLYIFGNYGRSTGADYWSYATDFDGTALGGSSRQVSVFMASSATTTYASGSTLNMVGGSATNTVVTNQGSGTFALTIIDSTLNALYYSLSNMNTDGLVLSGNTTVSSLSEGDYVLAVNGGTLVTLSSTTLNYNAGLVVTGASFATTSAITGVNVEVVGSTASAWIFTDHTGNFDGEAFDSDGGDDCGSVRWEDSVCLLTEQVSYRWRADDGGEGVPNSEWLDLDWTKRKRVTVSNADPTIYTNAVVEVAINYDGDMQVDFDDIRFTSSNGVTELNFVREDYTLSTDAVFWVEVPTVAADGDTAIYMYYGNGAATYAGVGTSTFVTYDDFEDDNIGEYAGDTALFDTDTTFAAQGTYGLEAANVNGRTTDGIYRTDVTVSQGETIRYFQYIDTGVGSTDEACTLFGVQSPGSNNDNYAVCLEQYGVDRVSIAKDVYDNDANGTVLATRTIAYSTGWYEIEVDWDTDDSIFVSVYRNDVLVATTSASDATYTSGGIGFTFWTQNGGWDFVTSRPFTETALATVIGEEQVPGGASWLAAINSSAFGIDVGTIIRPRFVIENTGLTISDAYRLQYAPKGASPSCEAVSSGSFVDVPVQASCSGSPICMESSAQFVNQDPTTDVLGGSGTFIPGEIIEDPSNTTASLGLDGGEYTEVEYAIEITASASDSNYCFRVSDAGVGIDSYSRVAELALEFEPDITSLYLNGGADIILFAGSTTTILATGTVSDLNGYDDIAYATTTIFRSGVGESCSADTNNCYIASGSSCTLNNCVGDSCDITCSTDIYYHADPTDIGTYAGETWRAMLSISDFGGAIATATAPSVDLITVRALSVDSSINYGTLEVNADTGSYNATTTLQNIGNDSIDVAIEGTNLTDGGSSAIPVSQQRFATSTFTYSACVFCSSLSSTSANYELDLTKPASTTPAIEDQLFWGIAIPYGISGASHQGTNIFYAIGD